MVAAALANSIFSGWEDRDTRMDCDHLKTDMPRYFFNLTNDIQTVVDTDGVQLEDEAALRREALEWSQISVRNRILPVGTGAGGA